MYVKVVSVSTESIYECERFLMRPVEGTFKDSVIDLESSRGAVSIEVDRTKSDIYVMNADGRTIDRYMCIPPPQQAMTGHGMPIGGLAAGVI